ncbi:unnamed protein product [Dovyalis caffra]|uniref:Uncharacterized protein n=1 Tax=Dovyalis caffra TaxID=77055 RepID=A0AAV1SX24_9ROSI|nr:unnamed protein product [Dovyalis caffra]
MEVAKEPAGGETRRKPLNQQRLASFSKVSESSPNKGATSENKTDETNIARKPGKATDNPKRLESREPTTKHPNRRRPL